MPLGQVLYQSCVLPGGIILPVSRLGQNELSTWIQTSEVVLFSSRLSDLWILCKCLKLHHHNLLRSPVVCLHCLKNYAKKIIVLMPVDVLWLCVCVSVIFHLFLWRSKQMSFASIKFSPSLLFFSLY